MTFYPRKNRILDNLINDKVSIGVELYTGSPSIVEILAYTGFDFYILDMEHAAVEIEMMRNCIRAADAAGITTICRVAENNYALIARVVEEGAQGVMVPHISTKEDVRKAIDSMRYPPEGKKGSCFSIRGANYSAAGWDDYLEHHSRETMFIPMIEDPVGVENMEEIMSELKPGRDAVVFGYGDCAQALAKPGEKINFNDPFLFEAYEKMLALGKKMGVDVIGGPWPEVSVENAIKDIESGNKICWYDIDQSMFYNLCLDIVKGIKGHFDGTKQ